VVCWWFDSSLSGLDCIFCIVGRLMLKSMFLFRKRFCDRCFFGMRVILLWMVCIID